MVLHVDISLKTSIQKNLSKSQKFASKISVAAFHYSQTIFLRFTVILLMILKLTILWNFILKLYFRYWSLLFSSCIDWAKFWSSNHWATVTLWWRGVVFVTTAVHWHHGVVVITTAELNSTQPELRFCAGSNPAPSVSGSWQARTMATSDNGPGWKEGWTPFVGQPYHKNNSSSNVQCWYHKILYTLHQISGVQFCWQFTSLKQCNIILYLKPHGSKIILTMREKSPTI